MSSYLIKRARWWVFLLAAALVDGWLLWHFHNRYWYPTDDGLYAHVAERLLNGEVLNRDVQDIHLGYIHFLHVLAFRLFGVDLVSLHYPLVLAAFVQALLAFVWLARRDFVLAFLGSVATVALGLIQFVSPTPNWYCLMLALAAGCWLVWLPRPHPARLIGAGIFLGVATMFRQLSGIWIAMPLLLVGFLERSTDGRGRNLLVARGVLSTMLAAIAGYLAFSRETEPGGVLLIAIWPMAILVWALRRVRTTNADAAAVVLQLAAGALIPALPLVWYHVAHGSLGQWLNDTVVAAGGETQMDFFGHGWFGMLPFAAAYEATASTSPARIANGLYWIVLPLLSLCNGLLAFKNLRSQGSTDDLVIPLLASFYALVSLYLEGPLYLYYTVGLSLIAVLWFAAAARPFPVRFVTGVGTAAIVVIALVFHAGQTSNRTAVQIIQGARVTRAADLQPSGLPRCTLLLDSADRKTFGGLVQLVVHNSHPGEPILAFPNDAELYFLADRPSPVRFYNSALGVRTADELADVIRQVDAHPPRVVVFRPDDKYNTDRSRALLEHLRPHYDYQATLGGREVYVRSDRAD